MELTWPKSNEVEREGGENSANKDTLSSNLLGKSLENSEVSIKKEMKNKSIEREYSKNAINDDIHMPFYKDQFYCNYFSII